MADAESSTQQLIDAGNILSELKGVSYGLRETIQGQHDRMLEAFIGERERNSLAAQLGSVKEFVASYQENPDRSAEELEAIKEAIEDLRERVALTREEPRSRMGDIPFPKPASISLAAAPAAVRCGASAFVTAVVRDPVGEPVPDGTLVEFSCTMGSVLPASATTIAGGVLVVYTAKPDIGGAAEMFAQSGGLTAVVTVEIACD